LFIKANSSGENVLGSLIILFSFSFSFAVINSIGYGDSFVVLNFEFASFT
jgi:hypothetical protein